jgi:glycine oxidase
MDAIVIGAGIIGSSIAWRLAQRGLKVALLDAGAAGGEASWAGAGMLAPGGEIAERNDWSDFALRSRALYPGFVEELRETGVPIDFRPNGAIEVALDEAEWTALQARAAAQRTLGIPSCPLAAGSPELARIPAAVSAMYYPDDAVVDPRDVMRALVAACRAAGVDLREHTRVTGLQAEPGGVAVETEGGRLSASVAVVAAGAWSGAIPFAREGAVRALPGSYPVRGHLIGYRPPEILCRTIVRHAETYLLQRSSGFLIAGASMENAGFDRTIDPKIVAGLVARAEALLPGLRGLPSPEAWLGFRPRANAHQPRIGRFEDTGVWLAYGHYRNGILLAPATAERVAGEITSSSGRG